MAKHGQEALSVVIGTGFLLPWEQQYRKVPGVSDTRGANFMGCLPGEHHLPAAGAGAKLPAPLHGAGVGFRRSKGVGRDAGQSADWMGNLITGIFPGPRTAPVRDQALAELTAAGERGTAPPASRCGGAPLAPAAPLSRTKSGSSEKFGSGRLKNPAALWYHSLHTLSETAIVLPRFGDPLRVVAGYSAHRRGASP